MPGRKAKPPRLYLRADDGRWVILDRGKQIGTGCGELDTEGAARALETYLGIRHKPTIGQRDPASIAVADVVTAYAESKKPRTNERERLQHYDELLARCERINEWWGDKLLSAVTTSNCAAYVRWRCAQPRRHGSKLNRPISTGTARRELEDLRSAINAYHRDHLLTAVPVVSLPSKGEGRQDWLTRHLAARLLAACLGYVWDISKNGPATGQNGAPMRRDRSTRTKRRHIARFVLLGLYSGRRENTIRRTQWLPNTTGPWMDLDRMIYHGKGSAEAKTKKRRPPAAIAFRLRPHLRRWARLDRELADKIGAPVLYVVHRSAGGPLRGKIKKGWAGVLADAGLGPEFVRHSLRHTAATWTMQAGTDIWQASGFLGMTPETLWNVYGHHHPDFQQEAAAAYGGKR